MNFAADLLQASNGAHPQADLLAQIACSETGLTSKGYPYLCDQAWILFRDQIPHLFRDGLAVLDWCRAVREHESVSREWPQAQRESLLRALKVIETVVQTAAVTAPPDLWLLRQVLATHREMGSLEALFSEPGLEPQNFAQNHQLNRRQLKIDFHFLVSRGYASWDGEVFRATQAGFKETLLSFEDREEWHRDWIAEWVAILSGKQALARVHRDWLAMDASQTEPSIPAWIARKNEIERGYRLVPLLLAMRVLEITGSLVEGSQLAESLPFAAELVVPFFESAGFSDLGRVNSFGERLFERGPGPFGIIAAYHPYLNHLGAILRNQNANVWVRRAANVAASQEANRRTFELANDALDRFVLETGFQYQVFIEHAVGKGEATRQRFRRDQGLGRERHYFGADLEDAAIDEAIAEQNKGLLPAKMAFIRNADVGIPERVVDALQAANVCTQGAVMVVGNGFHEIREQTNEKLTATFSGYQAAGILLIFTEETGLSDDDLMATAWNTYHAGFRHVHEMSGQGLRPSWDNERLKSVWSWRRCAQEAGYLVLKRYTSGTRSIFPTRKPERNNPSISVTYFCVPHKLAQELGIRDL